MSTTPKSQPGDALQRPRIGGDARRPQLGPRSWEAFQLRLAEALSVLEDEQYLVLFHKTSGLFVQFASFGNGGIRAEAVSNASLEEREKLDAAQLRRLQELGWLDPTAGVAEGGTAGHRDGIVSPNHFRDWPHPAPFAEAAALAVTTLRDVLGVQTPSRLCYRARNRRRERILLPVLRINPRREDPVPARRGAAELLWPKGWEELQQAAIAALRKETEIPGLDADESGDIAIRCGSALLWVRVNRNLPEIAVFSCVLRGVDPTPSLMDELNDLNTHRRPATFYFCKSAVIAATEVDCEVFHPPALLRAVRFLGQLVDEVDEDLSVRFGGRTAFEEAQSPEGRGTACQRAN